MIKLKNYHSKYQRWSEGRLLLLKQVEFSAYTVSADRKEEREMRACIEEVPEHLIYDQAIDKISFTFHRDFLNEDCKWWCLNLEFVTVTVHGEYFTVHFHREYINPYVQSILNELQKMFRYLILCTPLFKLPITKRTTEGNSNKVLEEKAEVKQEESKQQETKQEEVIFTNPHLIELERNIKLSLEEKKTIQKLSDYNEDIIKILRQNVEKLSKGEDISNDEISKIMDNEKHLIENDLKNVLSSDKTGSKFLKIYEYVIKNENVMTEFASLQQRKAVLITDYFMNKQLLPIEQITYICERGKNDIELRKIDEKISSAIAGNGANIREYTIIKVITLYEKAMLDNYYKARNIAKDNYFKDSAVKSSMSPEIVIGVANMLQNQALTLLKKCYKLSLMQFNELESIFELLNAQQIDSLKKLIEKIPDSKQRKLAHKILRELKL